MLCTLAKMHFLYTLLDLTYLLPLRTDPSPLPALGTLGILHLWGAAFSESAPPTLYRCSLRTREASGPCLLDIAPAAQSTVPSHHWHNGGCAGMSLWLPQTGSCDVRADWRNSGNILYMDGESKQTLRFRSHYSSEMIFQRIRYSDFETANYHRQSWVGGQRKKRTEVPFL